MAWGRDTYNIYNINKGINGNLTKRPQGLDAGIYGQMGQ